MKILRKSVVYVALLTMPAVLFAQINWTEHTIDTTFVYAISVYAIDINGDSAVDVLVADRNASEITWWENDGNENFTKHTIDSTFQAVWSVYAIDIEPDGDLDVLGAAWATDEITWWENDGNENFTPHTIDSTFDGPKSVYAIDVDGDNAVDVLGAASSGDEIAWWENDGNENFTKHTIDSTFDDATSVYAIDVDGDDDVDVLGAAKNGNEIAWWENDGDENFTKRTISVGFWSPISVYAIDVDGDNDIDVLGAGGAGIAWWENDGASPPNFTTEHTISDSFSLPQSVYAIDVDGDNDVDVLGAGFDGITWWENDGASPPNFTEYTISAIYGASVYAIDLDNDNDVDVLGAGGDRITWWSSDLLDIYDVAPVSIDIDSLVPEDTTFNPQSTVTNLGANPATFPVTCKIEPGTYSSTRTVSDLGSGDSIQITFFTPFTFESGFYTVTVYTRFVDDDNPANDTLEKVIQAYDPGIAEEESDAPETFSFSAPTISTGKTQIELVMAVETEVDLLVYDVLGRLSKTVVSRRFSAGTHYIPIKFDLPAGVYFYNLKTGSGENIIKKFLLVE